MDIHQLGWLALDYPGYDGEHLRVGHLREELDTGSQRVLYDGSTWRFGAGVRDGPLCTGAVLASGFLAGRVGRHDGLDSTYAAQMLRTWDVLCSTTMWRRSRGS